MLSTLSLLVGRSGDGRPRADIDRQVVRQVSVHCAERGRLLERIHGSLAEIFEGVAREMARAIDACERRVARERARVARQQAQMNEMHGAHAKELDEVVMIRRTRRLPLRHDE